MACKFNFWLFIRSGCSSNSNSYFERTAQAFTIAQNRIAVNVQNPIAELCPFDHGSIARGKAIHFNTRWVTAFLFWLSLITHFCFKTNKMAILLFSGFLFHLWEITETNDASRCVQLPLAHSVDLVIIKECTFSCIRVFQTPHFIHCLIKGTFPRKWKSLEMESKTTKFLWDEVLGVETLSNLPFFPFPLSPFPVTFLVFSCGNTKETAD